ncbi:small integral membrane protein 1 [Stegastes partitus]|uniref:Small integral membrane protein 1 n=1 Tax=Stegastes partitus TaxID=144197 RepID=A0A9Y4KMG4_9TELE|nr:PREDICTED: small integral membrane protein 1 [Stegastes partitus]
MEPNGTGSVQYDRWNEDNINMNVEASQSTTTRIRNTMCTGPTGIAVKVVGALVATVLVFIIGYVAGYYVHRC